MSDRLTGWVRTVTPKLWSVLVTTVLAWFAVHAPWVIDLLELLGVDLTSPAVVAGVVLLVDAVVLAAWQWVWTRVQPHLPDALARLLMGSAKSPHYARVTADGVYDITTLTPTERQMIADLRAIQIREAGVRANE